MGTHPNDHWSTIEKLLLLKLIQMNIASWKLSHLLNKVMEVWFDPSKTRSKNHRTKSACGSMRLKLKKNHQSKEKDLSDIITILAVEVEEGTQAYEDWKILDLAIWSEKITMLDEDKPPFWSPPDMEIEVSIDHEAFWDLDTGEFVLWLWNELEIQEQSRENSEI